MPPSKGARPTISDVANLAGVSYQTVSRVINDHPYVSDDARQRVEAAIKTLGYRPNKVATKLKSKVTNTVALVLYGGWFHGPMQIALNFELVAKTSGFDVIQTNITEPHKQLTEALLHMRDWAADGILAVLPVQGLPFEEIQTICQDTPIVMIEGEQGTHIPSVALDDAYGTRQIVEHLISLGHTRFCEISGPHDWFSAQIRHRTVHDVLEQHSLGPSIHIEANWTTAGGYQVMKRLLETDQTFTAVVSANDSMALGAIRALHQAGLSVPQDVAIAGYDDIPEAAYFTPALTTVRQNFIQLGILGFEYLLELMDNPEASLEQRIITPELIIRESARSL
jgi:DNA-binding LacI/PurR family transcriptional regulator